MALAAALALVAGAACAPPDTPPALERELPEEAREFLRPEEIRTRRVAAGVWHHRLWSPVGPWAVHVVEADLGRCDLSLRTLRARAREEGEEGREPVSSMVARAPAGVLVAVNADFFTPEGRALGAEVAEGSVTSARERPAVVWRPGGIPWIGQPRIEGDSLFAGFRLSREEGAVRGETEAVGGFPELLDAGRRVGDLGVGESPGFAAAPHPRTAVAVDPATRTLWLVVVDGRQPGYSTGMTLPELTQLLEGLGAREALNLDGGGSTVLVVRDQVVNRPSEEKGERPVVNALALGRDLRGCSR